MIFLRIILFVLIVLLINGSNTAPNDFKKNEEQFKIDRAQFQEQKQITNSIKNINFIRLNISGEMIRTAQDKISNDISNATFNTTVLFSQSIRFDNKIVTFVNYFSKLFQQFINQLQKALFNNKLSLKLQPDEEVVVDSNTTRNRSISRITNHTQWKQHGITVAGGNDCGDKLNQLCNPYGLSINNDQQSIYVVDYGNGRIVEWKFYAKTGQVIVDGNGQGNITNQSVFARDAVVDTKNNSLIICDMQNQRIVEWSRQKGTKNGQTIISDIDCDRLTMDKNGYIYFSDWEKNEVRRWKREETTNGTVVAGRNGTGNQLNQLDWPTNIFVDQDDSVYVSDFNNHRVMKWMKDAQEGIIVAGRQGQGDKLTQLFYPQGIIVDHLGNVYVADYGNNRIMCWSKESKQGRIIVGGNGEGNQTNQLSGPQGISFDQEGNLYVVDELNQRVQKFEIDMY